MTFTVTYRGADGSVATATVEASSRADCLAQMKARGITPTSVGEVKGLKAKRSKADGAPADRRQLAKKRPSAIHYCLAAAIVAMVAIAWWWCGRDTPQPPFEPETMKKAALPKEVKPAAVPKQGPAVTDNVTTNIPANSDISPSGKHYRRGRRIPVRIERVSDKIEKRHYEDGTWETVVKPYALREGETPPKKMFKSRIENFLALFAVPGEDVPPMPFSFRDDDVRKVLDTPIDVNMQEDDEDTIICKRAVMMLKEELRKAMDSGMSADDFAERLQSRQRNEAEQVRLSKRLIQKELKEGNREAALELLDKLNEHLSGQGIPPLVLTKRMRDGLGIDETNETKGVK